MTRYYVRIAEDLTGQGLDLYARFDWRGRGLTNAAIRSAASAFVDEAFARDMAARLPWKTEVVPVEMPRPTPLALF